MANTRLVMKANVDNNNITISLASISPGGPTTAEKLMAQKILETLASANEFPRIAGAHAGGSDKKR